MVSAVVGLAGRFLGAGYHHSAAHACCMPLFGGGRRIRFAVALAETISAEQKDFGVLHQAVGDGVSDGRVIEDVAPVGECGVSSDDSRALLAVSGRDDLIEEIRTLLVK